MSPMKAPMPLAIFGALTGDLLMILSTTTTRIGMVVTFVATLTTEAKSRDQWKMSRSINIPKTARGITKKGFSKTSCNRLRDSI